MSDTEKKLAAKIKALGELGEEVAALHDDAARLRAVGVAVPEAAALKLKKRRHAALVLEVDAELKAAGVEGGLKDLLPDPEADA